MNEFQEKQIEIVVTEIKSLAAIEAALAISKYNENAENIEHNTRLSEKMMSMLTEDFKKLVHGGV